MSVQMFQLTFANIRWYMKDFMFLYFLLLINIVTVRLSNHLQPSAICFMFFLGRVSTTTTKGIVLHLHSLLGLDECLHNLLSTENVSIKMLTEYLSCLILNCVFRFNGNYIVYSHLEECLTNFFRIARVYKHNLRQKLHTTAESLCDFFCLNNL